MTTVVTTTGTGTPAVSPTRAGAGALIRHGDLALQFDSGRNTLARLAGAGVRTDQLDAVFLTHYHSDHVVGLPDIVLSHWTQDFDDKAKTLEIVAPNGATRRFCERMLDAWDDDLAVRVEHSGARSHVRPNMVIKGFDTPDNPTEVWARGEVRVIAGPVRHEPVVGAVGYRVETPDGVVVISGDTIVCDEMADLARGADVVVYEAMRTDVVNTRYPPKIRYITEYHADTREIGAQMESLAIPILMLTHLIPNPHTDEDRRAFEDEVRAGGYTGTVMVCDDLDQVVLG